MYHIIIEQLKTIIYNLSQIHVIFTKYLSEDIVIMNYK